MDSAPICCVAHPGLIVFSWPPTTCVTEGGILGLPPACCRTWGRCLPSRVPISLLFMPHAECAQGGQGELAVPRARSECPQWS